MSAEKDVLSATAAPATKDAAGLTKPRPQAEKRWVDNAPSGKWLPRLDLAELWASRELVLILALRNIKVRYKQPVLGVAWALIQPLAAVAIFTFVMSRIAKVPS